MKSNLLLIESSTQKCSVALASHGKIVSFRETSELKAHAKMIAPFIVEVLKESGTTIEECDAVAVSSGPGSYTGLRVGVSLAKGLCYGADIPLISVCTLDILAMMGIERGVPKNSLILPMIDARRMEVYTASYNDLGERISEIAPVVLEQNSFESEFINYPHILFIGDGVNKLKGLLSEERIARSTFINTYPDVSGMVTPALSSLRKKEFEDKAYFEPFYLKEFIAGVSKKALI